MNLENTRATSLWNSLPRPFSVLAPMEDVTDTVFRRIVRDAGPPDVVFTEFTSTDGLCTEGRPRVIARLRFAADERPIVAQIWGNVPERYRRVAAEVREMGFDGLDINMGCPVKKITGRGACGALINNPSLAGELIAAAREGAGDLPVSVKTRIGVVRSKAEEWLGFLLAQGISALTVHGRTVAQQSEGEADWSTVALAVRLRDKAGLPTRIIGNGDIKTAAAFLRRVRETGADGVMIGRGIFENLFLFRSIRDALAGADSLPLEFSRLERTEKIAYFRRHLALHRETWGMAKSFDVLKKFAKTYVRAFEGAGKLVDAVMRTRTHEDAQNVLDAWAAEEVKAAGLHGSIPA
ncbi:MAG: tRNA-dihydrouridine synthase [Spirochaetia bacterium]|jgi:nifR3 family TIM-barrel protein